VTQNSLPTYRAVLLVLLACALLATACGSSATGLQGDTASEPAAAPTATQRPADEPAAVDRPSDPDEESDEADGSQIVLAADPTPEPEPAAPAIFNTSVGIGGAVGTIEDVLVTVGETLTTNADVDSLIAGQPMVDDSERTWLVTTVAFEGLIEQGWSATDSDIRVEDASGRPYPIEDVFDAAGTNPYAVDINGRTYREMRLAIQTDSLIEDTSGWNLVVGEPDKLPLVLPLNGSAYDDPYPLALPNGQEASFDTGPFAGCSAGAVFNTQIGDAEIALEKTAGWHENGGRGDARRVPANERLVTLDVIITGTAETDTRSTGTNCDASVLWPDFLLLVDGRPTQGSGFVPDVEGFASVTSSFVFQIPAAAQQLELVGGAEQESLAVWDVSLPAALGEDGAALVPFGGIGAELTGALGDRPAELTSVELGAGGAAGQIIQVDMAVGASSSTNANIDSFVAGSPQLDEDGRTWMVVGFTAESTIDARWSYDRESIVLVDPAGRPHSATEVFDRTGKELFGFSIDGVEFLDLRAAFETDGLVTDATGWTLEIGWGDAIPLALPLEGAATNEWPVPLTTGQTETLNYAPQLCRDGAILDAEITQARIDIEGYENNWAERDVRRVDRHHRFIVIDLELFNPKEDRSLENCGFILHWPQFKLSVDGRLTQAYSHNLPTVEPFTSQTLFLNYRVPKDAQVVTLIGGDNQEIVTWQIKDSREVLQEFGAEEIDERIVITLDETLLFAFGESVLQQGSLAPLSRVANVVNESSGSIDIVGHTDAIGDDASNQALSLARAEAVAAALVEAGVDESRLNVSGDGEASPVAPNENDDGTDNPAGRAENRRVEISFDSNG